MITDDQRREVAIKESDSWKKLEEDAQKSPCRYFARPKDGKKISCLDCPEELQKMHVSCEKVMRIDLIKRAKRLCELNRKRMNMTPYTKQNVMRYIGFLEGFNAWVWYKAKEEQSLAIAELYDSCVRELREAVMEEEECKATETPTCHNLAK